MRFYFSFLVLFFITKIFGFDLNAQTCEPSVIASCGSAYNVNSLYITQTMGEAIIKTISSTNNILTQGFNQPSNISVGIKKNNSELKFKVSIYPNPTTDYFYISFKDCDSYRVEFKLIDRLGNTIKNITLTSNNKIKDKKYKIPIFDLPSGIYLGFLSDNKNIPFVFKIIKTRKN